MRMLIAGAVVVLLGLLILSWVTRPDVSQAREAAENALARYEAERARADSAEARLQVLREASDRARARADSVERWADRLERVLAVRTDSLETLLAGALPDTLQPVLVALRRACEARVATCQEAREALRVSRDSVQALADSTGAALESARAALDSADVALAAQRALVEELEKGDLNLFGLKLETTCGLGAGAGVGTRGPDALVGVLCVVGR